MHRARGCFARKPVHAMGGFLGSLDLCYGEDCGGSSNGRTSGFGPENRGSNPCPPAERVCRDPLGAEPSGTAGAVLAAISHLHATPAANGRVAEGKAGVTGRAVVVLSGDVPLVGPETIASLIDAHGNGGAAATLVTSLLEDPRGYGRIVRGASGDFERVVETKLDGDSSPEERNVKEVNAGLYVFDADALEDVLPRLRPENEQGELYLPDALGVLR